jgi:hypothetical protein
MGSGQWVPVAETGFEHEQTAVFVWRAKKAGVIPDAGVKLATILSGFNFTSRATVVPRERKRETPPAPLVTVSGITDP